MSHRVSSPLGVVDIAEANGGVEPLGVGITLVYKQPDSRDAEATCPFGGGIEEHRGNAFATMVAVYGKAIEI